jgi:hypothetical protein
MVSPHPPLSDQESAALTSARGTFREALGALRNVTSLARSRNVGPKAILDVLADVRAGCRGLGQALDDLLKAMRPRVCEIAARELGEFLRARLTVLEAELDAARGSNMAARDRLRLEQALSQLLVELDAAHALIAMLEASVIGPTHAVEPHELLLQTYSTPPSGAHVPRTVGAVVSGPLDLQLPTRPRGLAALIGAAAEFAAEGRSGMPRVALSGSPDTWSAVMTLEPSPVGDSITVWGYGVIPPTLACLHASAHCLGMELSWDAPAPRLELAVKR